jgi:hypothetical protein
MGASPPAAGTGLWNAFAFQCSNFCSAKIPLLSLALLKNGIHAVFEL